MVDSLRNKPFFQQLEADHRKWLSNFNQQFTRNWEKLLGPDEEAAFAEARIRQLLESWNIKVRPNKALTENTHCPDLCCKSGDYKFYVEVTCIRKETAANKTGISDESSSDPKPCRPLTSAVKSKCTEKAKQCSNQDAPILLAVGTFNTFAAIFSFDVPFNLKQICSGRILMGSLIDVRTGEQIGGDRLRPMFDQAAFLQWNNTNNGVDSARCSISGLLLCSLGPTPIVKGVLNADATRPFNPNILPRVMFCQAIIDQSTGQLRVDWPGGNDV